MSIKVLYVDDDELNVELFKMVFKRHYIIIGAQNGEEALNTLRNNQDIQVVISDMKMHEMSGLEFIMQAQKDFGDKDFYMLTGYGATDDILQAMEDGIIIDCFTKPFDKKTIIDAIDLQNHLEASSLP